MTLKKRSALFLVFVVAFSFFTKAQKYEQTGNATYYAGAFQGRYTSSGEIFDNAKYTAAHATLPFHTLVKITNLKNNKYVIVEINDRCPAYYNHVVDLSQAAAKKLDMILAGVASVKLEVVTEGDLNYLSPCPDSILQNMSADSISLKSSILLNRFNLLPLEQYIFGNIISSHIKMLQLKNKMEQRQRWFTMNCQYLPSIQNFLS
jgi:rare lipoprotein A